MSQSDEMTVKKRMAQFLVNYWQDGSGDIDLLYEIQTLLVETGVLESFIVGEDDDLEDCEPGDEAFRLSAFGKALIK